MLRVSREAGTVTSKPTARPQAAPPGITWRVNSGGRGQRSGHPRRLARASSMLHARALPGADSPVSDIHLTGGRQCAPVADTGGPASLIAVCQRRVGHSTDVDRPFAAPPHLSTQGGKEGADLRSVRPATGRSAAALPWIAAQCRIVRGISSADGPMSASEAQRRLGGFGAHIVSGTTGDPRDSDLQQRQRITDRSIDRPPPRLEPFGSPQRRCRTRHPPRPGRWRVRRRSESAALRL